MLKGTKVAISYSKLIESFDKCSTLIELFIHATILQEILFCTVQEIYHIMINNSV